MYHRFGLPRGGEWKVRFFSGCYTTDAAVCAYDRLQEAGAAGVRNDDSSGDGRPATLAAARALGLARPVVARLEEYDRLPYRAAARVPRLSVTVLSQDT